MKNYDHLKNGELEYAYKMPGGVIFPDMLAAYNELFYNAMLNNLKIGSVFEGMGNTSWWEQYMLNTFQFSCAKNITEMRLLQENVFDANKAKRTFEEFKKIADPYMEKFSGKEWWLRTEYDLAVHGAQMADEWQDMQATKDIYPSWIYRCADSPCAICDPLDGQIFSKDGDDSLYPPNHFNCSCYPEEAEGGEISQEKIEEFKKAVPEQFQNNVGRDGIFPRTDSSYFSVLPNANESNSTMYSASPRSITKLNTRLYSKYAIDLTVNEWTELSRKQPSANDLIFQNKEWKLNVRLGHDLISKAHKKRGFENVKRTIEHPAEIWGRWADVKKQKDVLLNYITFDKNVAFIVETKAGVIQDWYFRSHSDSKQLRQTGIKFIK